MKEFIYEIFKMMMLFLLIILVGIAFGIGITKGIGDNILVVSFTSTERG